eukprot:c7041_g1_i1.p1 GENE.c7041_g1_i1~~c7041_g1_i1.p1  ORF type:complete len:471 (-),score=139.89 c7041_g1_i1:371-1732(-)
MSRVIPNMIDNSSSSSSRSNIDIATSSSPSTFAPTRPPQLENPTLEAAIGHYWTTHSQAQAIIGQENRHNNTLVRASTDDANNNTGIVDELQALRMNEAHIKRQKSNKVQSFYTAQNQMIDNLINHYNRRNAAYEQVKQLEQSGDGASAMSHSHQIAIAVNLSFGINVLLLVLKIVATIVSGSMAVLASAVDSLLDLMSGFVLYFMHRLTLKEDPYQYPEGKTRIEPIGIILFACLMGISSLQIIIEAARVLGNGASGKRPDLTLDTLVLAILAFTIISKFFLMMLCKWVAARTSSSSVEAYQQDHRNDVVTNTIGVVAVILAAKFSALWFLDSAAAIFISGIIMRSWIKTGSEHVMHLAGRTAPPALLQELTFIACHHSDRILAVETVRAYHFGSNFLVEIDLVLPKDMRLEVAHEIGESLQEKLEQLDVVQRAFVHLDFDVTHKPEHTGRK